MEEAIRCAICGGDPEDDHHLTGRGSDGEQLDDELVAGLCHDDHELLHEDLRQDGLDKPLRASTIFERVARRLQRVGVFLARVAEGVLPFRWIAGIAAALGRWADELNSSVCALDAWNPGWRLAEGVS
jgi:hypothetical protein